MHRIIFIILTDVWITIITKTFARGNTVREKRTIQLFKYVSASLYFFLQTIQCIGFLSSIQGKRADHKEKSGIHQLTVRSKWKITLSFIGFRG